MTREIPQFDLDLERRKLARATVKGLACVLVEASEADAKAHQNANQRSLRLGPDGQPVGFDGAAEADTALLAACLLRSEDGRPAFTAAQVGKWPASQAAPLIECLKRGSGMLPDAPQADPGAQDGGEGEEKNQPEGPPGVTEDTSA